LSIRALVLEVQAKSGPISESEKFRHHLFFLLYHHFQLESEQLGGLVLDQFDALNAPVASIHPWDCWLLRYRQIRAQFLGVKNSGSIYSSPCTYHHFRLQLECFGWWFLNLFDALNPAGFLDSLYLSWCLCYQPKISPVARLLKIQKTRSQIWAITFNIHITKRPYKLHKKTPQMAHNQSLQKSISHHNNFGWYGHYTLWTITRTFTPYKFHRHTQGANHRHTLHASQFSMNHGRGSTYKSVLIPRFMATFPYNACSKLLSSRLYPQKWETSLP